MTSGFNLGLFGLLQGLTEFLPVSSSGHLLFFRQLFLPYDQPLVVDIVLHIGSLLAIVYFFKDTLKKNLHRLVQPLLISLIPSVIVGLLFFSQIEALFVSPRFLALSFAFTTFILLFFNYLNWGKTKLGKLKNSQALNIGIFQALAIVPGISRSASTIFAGKLFGLEPSTDFSFAFLTAIPAILASIALSVLKLDFSSISFSWSALSIGFLSSFIASLLSLKLLQKILQNKNLIGFAFYTAALTAVSLVLFV